MKGAEKNLLIAVRERLRSEIGYSDQECEIEFDEMAPGTIGSRYVVVMPAGWIPGPRHQTSGTVRDLIYGVDVTAIKRIRHVPRDRRRDAFLNNLQNLAEELDEIITAIDWIYDVINDTNTRIQAENGSTEGFIKPLQFVGVDRRPRLIAPEIFSAAGQQSAGMARTVQFHGARRITTI